MYKLTILLLLCFTSSLFAQDIHLSQTHMTPLLVNPANAGSEYTIRGILNYRSQWGSVATPFNTMMASFDMNFKPKNSSKKGYFAGGLYFFNDNAGIKDKAVAFDTGTRQRRDARVKERRNVIHDVASGCLAPICLPVLHRMHNDEFGR